MRADAHIKITIGLGCDRGTSLHTLNTALDLALAQLSLSRAAIVAFASIDKKNDEVAMLALAAAEQKPLYFFSAEELSGVAVPNPSAVVQRYVGTPAVSEAAALLAANTQQHNLLLEKCKYLGADGKNATVSIAQLAITQLAITHT